MKLLYYISILSLLALASNVRAQVPLSPTVSPSIFSDDTEITVTYDVTGTSLAGLSNAYIWVWIPGGSAVDAKYNINPANTNTTETNNAKFTKSSVDGRTLFSITFTPADFFSGDISAATQMGMLLKGNDWADGQTTDFVTDFWDGSFTINLISPVQEPLFVIEGDQITIRAEVPVSADFELFVNDVSVHTATAVVYEYDYTVPQSQGAGNIRLVATSGGNTEEVAFQYLISQASPVVSRPAGVIPGINYTQDPTVATLCLWAPDKSSVYVRGDFTDWEISPDFIMNRDGEYFWLQIDGLTAGTEYAYQYLVNEDVFLADPYADKILDPDDQYIPESVYPDLKPFPQEAMSNKWYFNRVAVLQTDQEEYQWQSENYVRPDKENLVIYELLIRDFFENGERSYENLTDTIQYFKRLGVNAIELMPIMEFNGNEGWGYNPTFMFAPDKYYGPKDKLKEFIDRCHQEGIAVILDIALNHQDLPNAYVLMDYDFENNKPTASNKWFLERARHPFNVFYDMNHESSYARAYIDTVNHYWLNEFKVDGFRFDLSKGFTSVDYCTTPNCDTNAEVTAWSSRDESRINNLKRMADEIWGHTSDAIIILEHLAVNQEEKELADYRSDEGKGMMLWGNMNHSYNQNTMGWESGSDISGTSYLSRGWAAPHLVSYMESHDEERLAFRNKEYGNTVGTYSAKNLETSMQRIKAASVLFYTIPGPKMLWQFGEMGYDFSINRCEDGTIDGQCRLSPKPVEWDYLQDADRLGLFLHTSDLIKLHTSYPVFTNGTALVTGGSSLQKQVQVKGNPYTDSPASTDEMNVQAVANMGMATAKIMVNFAHTGTWYDYYNRGEAINVTTTPFELSMARGEYKLFTDVQIGRGPVTSVDNSLVENVVYAYPNPVQNKLILSKSTTVIQLSDTRGAAQPYRQMGNEVDLSQLSDGLYILMVRDFKGGHHTLKVLKRTL